MYTTTSIYQAKFPQPVFQFGAGKAKAAGGSRDIAGGGPKRLSVERILRGGKVIR
jgi:hypothetical protein